MIMMRDVEKEAEEEALFSAPSFSFLSLSSKAYNHVLVILLAYLEVVLSREHLFALCHCCCCCWHGWAAHS